MGAGVVYYVSSYAYLCLGRTVKALWSEHISRPGKDLRRQEAQEPLYPITRIVQSCADRKINIPIQHLHL